MKNSIIALLAFATLFLFSCGLENAFKNPVVSGQEVCECFEKARGEGIIANYACLDLNREYVEMYSSMASPEDSSALNTYSVIAGLCLLKAVKDALVGDDDDSEK